MRRVIAGQNDLVGEAEGVGFGGFTFEGVSSDRLEGGFNVDRLLC